MDVKIEIPGVDSAKGLDLYEDDVDLYVTVLRSYAVHVPQSLDKLRHVSPESLRDYASTVHGIKGTSNTIGAEDMRQAALNQELLAKAGDLQGVLAHNEDFLRQGDKLIADIVLWLKQLDTKGE